MLYGPVRVVSSPFPHHNLNAYKIMDNDSALTVAQLLFLEAEETSKPIHVYINSPGGSVTAGLAIYDTVCMASKCEAGNSVFTNPLDAICLVPDSYLLRRPSVLHGLSPACCGREGETPCSATFQHHDSS